MQNDIILSPFRIYLVTDETYNPLKTMVGAMTSSNGIYLRISETQILNLKTLKCVVISKVSRFFKKV